MKFFSSALLAFVTTADTALRGGSHVVSAQTGIPTPFPTPFPTYSTTPGIPTPFPTPFPTYSNNPGTTSDIEDWCALHEMTDQELFDVATSQMIGDYCRIVESTTGACNYYVKGKPIIDDGLPLKMDGTGTGCVPESSPSCYYNSDSNYPLTEFEANSMCVTDFVAGSTAQLRYGIRNGYCTDIPSERCDIEVGPSPTEFPTPFVSEFWCMSG